MRSWQLAPDRGVKSKDVLSLEVAKFMGRRAAGSCSGRGQPQKDAAATAAAAAAAAARMHAHMHPGLAAWDLKRARHHAVHPSVTECAVFRFTRSRAALGQAGRQNALGCHRRRPDSTRRGARQGAKIALDTSSSIKGRHTGEEMHWEDEGVIGAGTSRHGQGSALKTRQCRSLVIEEESVWCCLVET